MKYQDYIETFTTAYFEALLWAEHDIDDKDNDLLDDRYGIEDIDQQSRDEARAECDLFLAISGEYIEAATLHGEYADRSGQGLHMREAIEIAGHDFLLTRNGHGVGFWDRGLGAIGDNLSAIAESFGSVYIFSNGTNTFYIEKG